MKPATKQYMFIAAVFVATVALITFSLPREKTVNYDFALGKPWKYEQLTAPFNFAVYKSEQALQQERSEALAAQRPYYIVQQDKGNEAIGSYESFYRSDLYLLVGARLIF